MKKLHLDKKKDVPSTLFVVGIPRRCNCYLQRGVTEKDTKTETHHTEKDFHSDRGRWMAPDAFHSTAK